MALPAGSVAVTEIALVPSTSCITTWKAPVPSATPMAVRPFAASRAVMDDLPCVLPTIVTESALTVDLSAGAEIVILGGVVSST